MKIMHEDELSELGIDIVNEDQSIPESMDLPFHDPWVVITEEIARRIEAEVT